ncbi:LytTR family DNA-binding domain-containing protein [Reichenbachiella sp. MSK19-1]|uniref:LytR/AlgR family response regulator transcription factor n=1 Tax=Reichenbachiella sp. MSK19-1 TaxID=1897631 RepID=UPI000E6B89B6|nr:LytTR family DNA-binding domain-containing protein [Reichenbachiella sp. MSK19-1]RJE70642.1 DNA-binding response regulator [Reichenbachiella sp. MSK19-1]
MKVVIIEDEDLASEFLEKLLLKSPYDLEVIAILDSKMQAFEWFQYNSCDLIFSDIHLGDGMSFEIFDSLDIKTPIIFTTAFDKYAIQSFEYFAIDYLLKPYNREKLNSALEKYTGLNATGSEQGDKIEMLLKEFKGQAPKKSQERFLVTRGDQLISLKSSDIGCFMADDKYLYLYTKEGDSYLYEDTISNLALKLDPEDFFKVNRKYIVSHAAIKTLSKFSKNRINVELGIGALSEELILVSAKNVGAFKNWLNGVE